MRAHPVTKNRLPEVNCQRPYTGSRPITEVEQRRARSVHGWVSYSKTYNVSSIRDANINDYQSKRRDLTPCEAIHLVCINTTAYISLRKRQLDFFVSHCITLKHSSLTRDNMLTGQCKYDKISA
ncbi:unnamed protein product [Euphydryas editha]|uniref:Uncharacterized protein n=1 Tax=Euphydryas editha TaxID=104508 RepID=A0AAU9UWF9_EUPED|nr:unnamed protein product [Euphydryas editha]